MNLIRPNSIESAEETIHQEVRWPTLDPNLCNTIIESFFNLLGNHKIKELLIYDRCWYVSNRMIVFEILFSRYSDGYHLAMVAIYFDRLGTQSGFQNTLLINSLLLKMSFDKNALTLIFSNLKSPKI